MACEGLGHAYQIAVWKGLVKKHPQEEELVSQLKWACEKMGEPEKAATIWADLVADHPESAAIAIAECLTGDIEQAVHIWESLKSRYPDNNGLEREWEQACRAREMESESIEEWRELLGLKPRSELRTTSAHNINLHA